MDSAQAMHLITLLRGRGFTVEITGMIDAEVTIRSSDGETSDMAWTMYAPSTEEALLAAARQAYDDLVKTAALLAPFVAEVPSDA